MPGVGAAVAWHPVAFPGTRAAEPVVAEPCSSGMPWPEPGQRLPCRRPGALAQSACLDVAAAVVGGAVELAPLEKRPRPGHQHHSRWRRLALVRSSMPGKYVSTEAAEAVQYYVPESSSCPQPW